MKLNKKKVFALALVICLLATLSLGSLAWFTDKDEVTNDFMVAGSEDGSDGIFSVDVWEEGDDKDDGLEFQKILPGDVKEKVAHVKNTGAYDQYIRVKIVVSEADVWQDVYNAYQVPVTEFVNVDKVAAAADIYGTHSAFDGENFVYYLYYNTPLTADNKDTEENEAGDFIVFDTAYISHHLTKEQAAAMGPDGFSITVTADAVQTANICTDDDPTNDVFEAFSVAGMGVPVNTAYVADMDQLKAALPEYEYVVLTQSVSFGDYDWNYEIENDVEIYLNNCTLTTRKKNYSAEDRIYAVIIKAGAEVAISGYGTVVLSGDRGINVNGNLTIYGGTYRDEYNRPSNTDEALFNVYETGKLHINAGELIGTDCCVAVRNGNGKFTFNSQVSFAVTADDGEPIR